MRKSGFTLIELLITIAVIGVLASVIVVAINPLAQIQKTRDAQRKSDLAQMQRALEQYYQDNGRYPDHSTSSPTYRIQFPAGTTIDWGNSFAPYMQKLPQDPAGNFYVYFSPEPSNQSYYLYASLQRGTNDPQICTGGVNPWCASIDSNGINTDACGGHAANPCNFGLTSPNTSP